MHLRFVILYLFTSISFLGHAFNIQGFSRLDGASDHSGITVTCIPKSPTAKEAIGYTLSNGSYSITVTPGLYDIRYSKTGCQDVLVTDQFIDNNKVMADVTLSSKPIVNVVNEVAGNWTNDNTYVVTGDVTIPQGAELAIQAGTEIKFAGYYRFDVRGKLAAIGTAEKKITFTSAQHTKSRGDWYGITIQTTADTSWLVHCQIEYASSKTDEKAIVYNLGNLRIKNSLIRGAGYGGIYNTDGGYMRVEDTEVFDAYFYGIVSGSSSKQSLLYYNHIHDIDLIGVSDGAGTLSHFIGNRVYNTGYTGIQVQGNVLIERNIIYNAPYGVFVVGGMPTIRNNTIFNNGHGIGLYDTDFWHPTCIVSSNVIYQNRGYGIYCQGVYMPQKVENNLFYGNASGVANRGPIGLGQVLTENANGSPADTYLNIFDEPKLFSTDPQDPYFLYLQAGSPAIDAGDPLRFDNNQSIVDCGAIPYEFIITALESIEQAYSVDTYPNPVTDSFTLRVGGDGKKTLPFTMTNTHGLTVAKGTSVNGVAQEINLNGLANGVYLLRISTEAGPVLRRIVKN